MRISLFLWAVTTESVLMLRVNLFYPIINHQITCVGFLFLPQVSLLSFSVESEHTFLDYIKGG